MDNSIEAALHYAREHILLIICLAFVLYSAVSRITSPWNRVLTHFSMGPDRRQTFHVSMFRNRLGSVG